MHKCERVLLWAACALTLFCTAGLHGQSLTTPVVLPVGSVPQGVAVDPVSNLALIANSGDNSVSLVDLVAQRVTAAIPGISSPAGVAFNNLGLAVIANQQNNTITVLEVAARRIRAVIPVGSRPVAVAVNPNTNTAVVANSLGNSISIVDLNRLVQVAVVDGIANPLGLQAVAVHPGLNIAAIVSSSANALYIVDLNRRQITAQVPVEQSPSGVAIEPEGRTAVVTNLNSNSVSLVDLQTNSIRATIASIPTPRAVAISPSTRSAVVTTGFNGTVEVISLTAAAVENTIFNVPSATGVAFSPNTGRTIVTLPNNNSAAIIASLGLFTSVNAASSAPVPVAASSIASGFGSELSTDSGGAVSLPLPTTLVTTSVRVGNVAAPLFFVSKGQVNFQVPRLPVGTYQVQVLRGGQQVASGTISIAATGPGIFTENQQGTGQAAALTEDNRPNGSPAPGGESNAVPSAAGSVIQLFGTGGGLTNPEPPTGSPATAAASTIAVPAVQIGGQPAEVLYSGASPGLVGVWQINARIPSSVRPGTAVPVVVTIGGRASNTASIVVQ